MTHLLDTNICIYIIKKHPEKVLAKLEKLEPGDIAISAITWSELIYGAEKSTQPKKNLAALRQFILPFAILPWTELAAAHSGEIRAFLEKSGETIGAYDLQIAGHALAESLTLVSNNEREFSRVKALKTVNWTK